MGKRLDHSAWLRALGEVIAAAQQQALADGEQLAAARERLLAQERPVQDALGDLGLHVGDTQEQVLAAEEHLHRVRARLLAPSRRPRSRAPLWGAFALAGASAAILLVYLLFGAQSSLQYRIDGRDGEVGAWIAPQGDKTSQMLFSDGSQIELQARSNARVQRLDRRGAHVLLERGTARVYVHPRRKTHWELSVGPFEVTVVGTRFSIAWDPERELFSLELKKGSVRVKGPALKQRVVSAGERVRVWVRQGKVERHKGKILVARKAAKPSPSPVSRQPKIAPALSAHGSEPTSAASHPTEPKVALAVAPAQAGVKAKEVRPAAAAATLTPARAPRVKSIAKRREARRRSPARRASEPGARTTGKAPLSVSAAATTTTGPAPSGPATKKAPPPFAPVARPKPGPWDLARAGRYKQAMAASAKQGWSKVVASASAKQLLVLADAARLSAMPARARKLYLALRSRFHGSPQAAAAAFALGRLAFDQQRKPALAARYFERYLAEEPRGPLAKAALGRLMEARVRAGQWDFACATARSYLVRFSGGAHTRLAQRVVARCNARR